MRVISNSAGLNQKIASREGSAITRNVDLLFHPKHLLVSGANPVSTTSL